MTQLQPTPFDRIRFDDILSAALNNQRPEWPAAWRSREMIRQSMERIAYHGIAGLLAERSDSSSGWPLEILAAIRTQAIAQAKWELRHGAELHKLLDALSQENVAALLLKGTAIAYDLYCRPSARARGDTDLLVARADRQRARSVLGRLGYERSSFPTSDTLSLQEGWMVHSADGLSHHIDLHFEVMNSPALQALFPFASCAARRIPLPRLCDSAYGMDRANLLIHTCLHRAMHLTAPYFVGDRAYHGDDRLIWTHDIHLLAGALTDDEWKAFAADAHQGGVGAVCARGLQDSALRLGTAIPDFVQRGLAEESAGEAASAYLLGARQLGRARRDLLAVRGIGRKAAYLWSRMFPPAAFMRAKYPGRSRAPLLLLYARRALGLLGRRASG